MSWLRNFFASISSYRRRQSASLTLNEVVIAMNNAVSESRRMFEDDYQRQLSNAYFNEDGTPIFKDIQMQEPDGSWKLLQIPLISLVPTIPLQIQQVSFEFEANVVVEPDVVEGGTQSDIEIVMGGKPRSAHTPVTIKVRLGGSADDPDGVHVSFTDPRMPVRKLPWTKRGATHDN